jgi:hypothetical protein
LRLRLAKFFSVTDGGKIENSVMLAENLTEN